MADPWEQAKLPLAFMRQDPTQPQSLLRAGLEDLEFATHLDNS
jgi:hypothetical protein